MPQATFTPRYCNPPRGNARSATVKDNDGGIWWIHPGDLGKYHVGVPATVEYRVKDSNGRQFYEVTSMVGQLGQQANPQAHQGTNRVPTPQQLANAQNRQPQPNPQADPRKSEDIFVCGVVNHAIAHQSYPVDMESLRKLILNARAAWKMAYVTARNTDEPPFPGSPDDYGDVDLRG